MPLCLCTFCFLCLAPATTPGLSLPIPRESRQVMSAATVNPEVLALFLTVFHALYHPVSQLISGRSCYFPHFTPDALKTEEVTEEAAQVGFRLRLQEASPPLAPPLRQDSPFLGFARQTRPKVVSFHLYHQLLRTLNNASHC